MFGPFAPSLIGRVSSDGHGSDATQVLSTWALAFKLGMNFGGVYGLSGTHTKDSVPSFLTTIMFNNTCSTLFLESPPKEAVVVPNHTHLLLSYAKVPPAQNFVYLDDVVKPRDDTTAWFAPAFLDLVRSQFMSATRHVQVPTEPFIAVHLGRANVNEHEHPERYTKDEDVLAWIRRFRQHLPSASVHIVGYTRKVNPMIYSKRFATRVMCCM
eukprot:TRINITY_DN9543_c0_g3_i2.p1 TRINITY_DN9543_c0_g3~~TRINITY_DN9543_c0_g3_i2.p1  ORF type:complete len:212 (-),score=12.15 TRINITY_DN9543_c0_g3_i2:251-886(-)